MTTTTNDTPSTPTPAPIDDTPFEAPDSPAEETPAPSGFGFGEDEIEWAF